MEYIKKEGNTYSAMQSEDIIEVDNINIFYSKYNCKGKSEPKVHFIVNGFYIEWITNFSHETPSLAWVCVKKNNLIIRKHLNIDTTAKFVDILNRYATNQAEEKDDIIIELANIIAHCSNIVNDNEDIFTSIPIGELKKNSITDIYFKIVKMKKKICELEEDIKEASYITNLNDTSDLRESLLALQPNNQQWIKNIDRFMSFPSATVSSLERLINNYWIIPSIEKINGVNQFIDGQEVSVDKGKIKLTPTYTLLRKKYSSIWNPQINLDTINITDFISITNFYFEENGIYYNFSGCNNGSFTINSVVLVEPKTLDILVNEIKELGYLFDLPVVFNDISELFANRYSQKAQFDIDRRNLNIRYLYKKMLPNDLQEDVEIIILDSLESKFEELKQKTLSITK